MLAVACTTLSRARRSGARPVLGLVEGLAGEAGGERGGADAGPEGAADPALIGGRHVAVHDELAPRDAVGLALLEVDVEVDLVGLAAAGEGEAGVAAEVALVEHEALEPLDLVGLPLAAGGVAGVADRRALVGAEGLRVDAAPWASERGRAAMLSSPLDVALGQGDVAVDADAADALAGHDLDRQLAGAVGEEGRAVAELLQLGADRLGVEVAGLEAEDATPGAGCCRRRGTCR